MSVLQRTAWAVVAWLGWTAAAHGQTDPNAGMILATGFEADAASQIALARATPDGEAHVEVDAALVTYARPMLGTDAAGFFVQGGRLGPALFIRVDPSTLSPPPSPGDTVDFTVTAMGTVLGRREATGIADFVRISAGSPLDPVTQDVSAATDLISAIDSYDSELVSASGVIAGAWLPAGHAFLSAPIDTAGIAGDPNLVLRLPQALAQSLALGPDCTIAVQRVPILRSGNQAQITPTQAGEFSVADCAEFGLTGAVATSPTTLRLEFNRVLDAATVQAAAVALSGGLAAVDAQAQARVAIVTTTVQVPGNLYVVTIAPSFRDVDGYPLSGANIAQFLGYSP